MTSGTATIAGASGVGAVATAGAFRVVSERELDDPRDGWLDARAPHLRHLRDEGLIRTVPLDGRERAVLLTDRGRDLLEAHRRDRGHEPRQAFYAGFDKRRELTEDAGAAR